MRRAQWNAEAAFPGSHLTSLRVWVQRTNRAGNSLIAHSLKPWAIRSDHSKQMSKSLRSLMKHERSWANRSGRSEEMSDHERIAQVAHETWAIRSEKMSNHERITQVAHQKWANVSNSLSTKEQMSESNRSNNSNKILVLTEPLRQKLIFSVHC